MPEVPGQSKHRYRHLERYLMYLLNAGGIHFVEESHNPRGVFGHGYRTQVVTIGGGQLRAGNGVGQPQFDLVSAANPWCKTTGTPLGSAACQVS